MGDWGTGPPVSKRRNHGRRRTGFSGVGVWEQGEDVRRYWVGLEIPMEYIRVQW